MMTPAGWATELITAAAMGTTFYLDRRYPAQRDKPRRRTAPASWRHLEDVDVDPTTGEVIGLVPGDSKPMRHRHRTIVD